MAISPQIIRREVAVLQQCFEVELADDLGYLIIKNFPVPKNWEKSRMDLLLKLPENYPLAAPHLFVRSGSRLLKRDGKTYAYFHSFKNTKTVFPEKWNAGWWYVCTNIRWNSKGTLISYIKNVEWAMSTAFGDTDDRP